MRPSRAIVGDGRWLATDGAPNDAARALEGTLRVLTRRAEKVHRNRRLHRAAGAREERPRVLARQLADLGDDALASVLELLVRCAEVDHQVAVRLAKSDHRTGR